MFMRYISEGVSVEHGDGGFEGNTDVSVSAVWNRGDKAMRCTSLRCVPSFAR